MLSYLSTKTLGGDVIMLAVKKSTSEYEAMVRESVLPWYKREGVERGETRLG